MGWSRFVPNSSEFFITRCSYKTACEEGFSPVKCRGWGCLATARLGESRFWGVPASVQAGMGWQLHPRGRAQAELGHGHCSSLLEISRLVRHTWDNNTARFSSAAGPRELQRWTKFLHGFHACVGCIPAWAACLQELHASGNLGWGMLRMPHDTLQVEGLGLPKDSTVTAGVLPWWLW